LLDDLLRAAWADMHDAAARVGRPEAAVRFGEYAFRALEPFPDVTGFFRVKLKAVERV
jgi:hypothetical protein